MAIYNKVVSRSVIFPLQYFEPLVEFYHRGSIISRIRVLEAVLIIVIQTLEYEDYVNYGQTQREWMKSNDRRKSVTTFDLLTWLHETLPEEKQREVVTTFFLFFKVYADHIMINDRETWKAMISLHDKLKHVSNEYGKLELLDKIQGDWLQK